MCELKFHKNDLSHHLLIIYHISPIWLLIYFVLFLFMAQINHCVHATFRRTYVHPPMQRTRLESTPYFVARFAISVCPPRTQGALVHKAFALQHSDQGFHLLREVESTRRETHCRDSCGTCVLAVLCSAAPGGFLSILGRRKQFSFGECVSRK